MMRDRRSNWVRNKISEFFFSGIPEKKNSEAIMSQVASLDLSLRVPLIFLGKYDSCSRSKMWSEEHRNANSEAVDVLPRSVSISLRSLVIPLESNLCHLFSNIPHPKKNPGTLLPITISSSLISLSISVYTSPPWCLCDSCPVQREQQRGDFAKTRKRKENIEGKGGKDEFHRHATKLHTFLKGCASCSFVPTSTRAHTATRTYTNTHSPLPENNELPSLLSSFLSFFLPFLSDRHLAKNIISFPSYIHSNWS